MNQIGHFKVGGVSVRGGGGGGGGYMSVGVCVRGVSVNGVSVWWVHVQGGSVLSPIWFSGLQ